MRHRRSEQRHQAVARELVHHAFHPVDLGEDHVEILLEEVVVLLGIEALGDADRADEVAEEHRDEFALAGDRREARDRLRRRTGPSAREDASERIARGRWEIVVVLGRELQPAVGTEAEARLDRGAAPPATRAHAGPARMTELLPGNEIDAARDAAHSSALRWRSAQVKPAPREALRTRV